jgi:hypothetical protein
VRGDFLEAVDPVHAQDAGVFVDGQLVVLGEADLFSVKQSDNKHGAVLSIERRRGAIVNRPAAGPASL